MQRKRFARWPRLLEELSRLRRLCPRGAASGLALECRRGLIERWGRGTNKILAEAERAGCPEPEFEEVAGAFVVRFRTAGAKAEKHVPEELSERSLRILAILDRHGPLRAPAVLKAPGEPITLRTLQRELRRLREGGRVAAHGRGELTTYNLAGERR